MELGIDEALQRGVSAHKAGDLNEADKFYTAILKVQPQHPDANHNMGVLAVSLGKVRDALSFFKTALEANPATEQFWLSYIDALIKLERLNDAREHLKRGRESGLQGKKVDQLESRLGDRLMAFAGTNASLSPTKEEMDRLVSLYGEGNLEEALVQGDALAKKFPHNHIIPNILGAIFFGLGEHEAAVVHYGKSIEIKPF